MASLPGGVLHPERLRGNTLTSSSLLSNRLVDAQKGLNNETGF
jgi:hypothetical protein